MNNNFGSFLFQVNNSPNGPSLPFLGRRLAIGSISNPTNDGIINSYNQSLENSSMPQTSVFPALNFNVPSGATNVPRAISSLVAAPSHSAGTIGVNPILDSIKNQGLGNTIKTGFANLGQNIAGGLKANWTNIATKGIETFIPDQDKTINITDSRVERNRDLIGTALMNSGNPALMATGLISKTIDQTGGYTDASQGLGGLADIGNKIGAYMGGLGYFVDPVEELETSERVARSSSYGNLNRTKSFERAQNNSGGKFLFNREMANNIIREESRRQNLAEDILLEADEYAEATSGSMPLFTKKIQGRLSGLGSLLGTTNAVRAGSKGGKLDINRAQKLLKLSKGKKVRKCGSGGKFNVKAPIFESPEKGKFNIEAPVFELPTYKSGGNIIPSGALHARKNNLDQVNEGLASAITHKGIPVVSIVGDKIIQQAEIEHSEIIFSKQTTDKLEEYLKKWNRLKEEEEVTFDLEVECGKFLASEILHNTEDKTNLIKQVKKDENLKNKQ